MKRKRYPTQKEYNRVYLGLRQSEKRLKTLKEYKVTKAQKAKEKVENKYNMMIERCKARIENYTNKMKAVRYQLMIERTKRMQDKIAKEQNAFNEFKND